jgi:chromosome segregation ATPase
MKHLTPYLVATTVLLLPCTVTSAQEANPAEAMMKRMRETLRNTMIQLQTAQTEVATLQAKQIEQEAEIAELKAKVTALTKQGDADKAAAARTATELNGKIATQTQEMLLLNQSLEKWKAGYKQAAEVANATETKRSALASKVVQLDRERADLTVKNKELYKLGSEILVRYEKFGLGRAIAAREPFTGIARVKFETLVQDYADKLVDQKLRPGVTEAADAPPASAASKTESAPAASPGNTLKPKS